MTSQAPTRALLVELFTEELPPKALRSLGQAFQDAMVASLSGAGLIPSACETRGFASPRRLGVLLSAVASCGATELRREKLLPTSIGLDATGAPLPPLIKKLEGLGLTLGQTIEIDQLQRVHDGRQEVLWVDTVVAGPDLLQAAQAALEAAIAALPIPKLMRYPRPGQAHEEVRFVRPVHRLLALYGSDILPLTALGLDAGRVTEGHRFHCPEPLSVACAQDYEGLLEGQGRVVAHFETRRGRLVDGLQRAAGDDHIIMPEALLDEVNGLVEWPVVLNAQFDDGFLSVPQECLILTMQQNQKYFACTDASGRLVNRFLLVSNLESRDPSVVAHGNERVLRARLSDAKFFYDQDRKRPLESRLSGMEQVVHHNKIGSQAQRVDRLAGLSFQLAPLVGADPGLAQRAARLAKADLLTDMVGEFPELQGVIGSYYAQHDGEDAAVADAIRGHYHPRFAGDSLPSNPEGLAVALADKLETLVGIWGIGLLPTGEKDPFGLRRAALGVVRILVESSIPASLSHLLGQTAVGFRPDWAAAETLQAIQDFITDRGRRYLRDQGFDANAIEAVLAECPGRLDQWRPRLEALEAFMKGPASPALASANKRIGNILKKAPTSLRECNMDQLVEPAERALAQSLSRVGPQAQAHTAEGRYAQALEGLAELRQPVDTFFDEVMVNAEDPSVRENRLALLAALHRAMNQVADLSRLAT
jgi:glycyl-tRNA synthetase beta chain